ncbi:uncharacterized protein LOC115968459 [Quercus lobata]|uniref:uncharacterized protein LOC115968459 n=1 Tax=Quercus lobata TaxID=97700 RepID=UPI00124947C5|nr:uncharacterized protein LOC115968459 [Quercus lobata]
MYILEDRTPSFRTIIARTSWRTEEILDDMKKCRHGVQIIQHHDFFQDDCLGEYLLLFPKLLTEGAAVRPEQSTSQFISSNSANAENLSSTSRPRLFENEDRLHGAVLLARARLLECLRGVPLSANRIFVRVRVKCDGTNFNLLEGKLKLRGTLGWEDCTTKTSRKRDFLLSSAFAFFLEAYSNCFFSFSME